MFGRILIGVGLVCLLLGDPTESYARDQRAVSSHGFTRSMAHRSPVHRFSGHRFGSRGYYGEDLLGSVVETIIDEAIDHLTNAEAPVDGPELVPADLSSLDGYGVRPVMKPYLYALLTSGNPAAVREGNMMLMHYRLLALDKAEGRDHQRVRRASALVLPSPLDPLP